jgi:sec-independent protein translocase protein TatA
VLPLAFAPGPFEIALLAGIVLLLFGSRLPSAMRSLGQSVTEFKKGIREDKSAGPIDGKKNSESDQ